MNRIFQQCLVHQPGVRVILGLSVCLPAALALADSAQSPAGAAGCEPVVAARFIESAPRDRFEFSNTSTPGWSIASITLDLEGSLGKLIFDTTESGAGVEVFQEFRVEEGSAALSNFTLPGDGDRRIELDFESFANTDTFSFSIDVDDQLAASELGQIRVSGGEIEGARVSARFVDTAGVQREVMGVFGTNAQLITAC